MAASAGAPPPGGRLTPAHRSMTRLNVMAAALPQQPQQQYQQQHNSSSNPLAVKSMTRLNSSQQNMNAQQRYSSAQQVSNPDVGHAPLTYCLFQVITASSRSVTCITNGPRGMSLNVGHNSPTKSMSSGSVTGVTADGREILTVNVEQINADLLRQASTVLSGHDIGDLPALSSSYAPFSLPNNSRSRMATSTGQAQALPLPAAVVSRRNKPAHSFSTLPSPRRRNKEQLNEKKEYDDGGFGAALGSNSEGDLAENVNARKQNVSEKKVD